MSPEPTLPAARQSPERSRPPATGPRLLAGRVMRGCNVHHRTSVFVQRVNLDKLVEARPAAAGARFAGRFADRFEGHGEIAETFDGVLLEAIVAIEMSAARTMGRAIRVPFSKIVPVAGSPAEIDLVWECQSGTVSRAAAKASLSGILELLPTSISGLRRKPRGRFAAQMRKLLRRCRRREWSKTTAVLAEAAKERGLPCEPLAGDYLRLGDGVLQQVVSASAISSLDAVYPSGMPARIPVAVIVGERGRRALARELDGLLRATGRMIGLATRKLTTISGRPVDPTSHGRGDGARFLLGDPRIEMVISATSARRIVRRGLRLDRATVTAILE